MSTRKEAIVARRDEPAAVWPLLAAQPVLGDMRVRETGIVVSAGPVLLGLDVNAGRHLLVPLRPDEPLREDRTSHGVHIVDRRLLDGERTQRFADVACRLPHLAELFNVLVDEMLDSLERQTPPGPAGCHAVLERWRELLEHERGTLLGTEQLAALVAELWYLREIVERDPARRLDCWVGPHGDRHDLRRRNMALEVKATLVREGLLVEIHGHEQLEPPEGGQLYLAVMRLERIDQEGLTVPELVRSLLDMGIDRKQLVDLLDRVGYRLTDSAAYDQFHFRVRDQRMYLVDAQFPRIIASSFVSGVMPRGILRLRYFVDLTGESPVSLPPHELDALMARFAA
jgi:hypothetical protein